MRGWRCRLRKGQARDGDGAGAMIRDRRLRVQRSAACSSAGIAVALRSLLGRDLCGCGQSRLLAVVLHSSVYVPSVARHQRHADREQAHALRLHKQTVVGPDETSASQSWGIRYVHADEDTIRTVGQSAAGAARNSIRPRLQRVWLPPVAPSVCLSVCLTECVIEVDLLDGRHTSDSAVQRHDGQTPLPRRSSPQS